MKQLKSVKTNVFGKFTLSQLMSATLFAVVVAKLLKLALKQGMLSMTIPGILLGISALTVLVIYYIFFRKEVTIYNSVAIILYGMDYLLGNTKTNKYECTAARMKSDIPINTIHKNSMIEFPGKEFGIMLNLYLPNVTDAGRAIFLLAHVELLDTLPEGIIFKILKFSSIDDSKPLVEQVKKAINDPDTTKEMKKHLHTTYDKLMEVPGKVGWHAVGFISVGKYKNADKALVESKVHAEVIINSLIHATVVPIIMTDSHEIIWVYRQMLSMKKVL